MALLPAAIDPNRVSLNITPYDNDNTAAAGSTTLRHIDNSARLAWSTFGSVQSDPYRWGRATLPGYTPPAGPADDVPHAERLAPEPRRRGSPQTIAQSARNGVPISGREPAPEQPRAEDQRRDGVGHHGEPERHRGAAGTARLFLYDVNPIDGNKSYTRVWNTSCDPATNPAPDYGLSACSAADGTTPPWAPDMMGGILASQTYHGRGRDEHVVAERGHGGPAGERRVAARVLRERGERGAGVRRAGQGHVDRRHGRRHGAGDALAVARARRRLRRRSPRAC